jgi:putative RNA 2'-phosphotransferase
MKITKEKETKISKSLSYWLRHNPDDINLNMSSNGWVDVKELIEKAKHKVMFDFNDLHQVVKNNNKQRFAFDRNMCMIRANQGHSKELAKRIGLKIDSQVEVIPPTILYHGTKKDSVDIIKKEGLKPMSRQHVHLSIDTETAEIVAGRRKGDWVILEVEAKKLHMHGHKVYVSENGVYLTDEVPPEYIIFE